MPKFKKIVANYSTMLERVGLPATFASQSTEKEAREQIQKDIRRAPLVDFNGKTIQSHQETWQGPNVSNAYTQGNDTAGVFGLWLQSKVLNSSMNSEFYKKHSKAMEMDKEIPIFRFAYYDVNDTPCGFSLAYSKNDFSLWVAAIINNTPVAPEHRTVTFFCPNDIIDDPGDQQLNAPNVLPEILQTLNSSSIQRLLHNILNSNGTVNLDAMNQLQERVKGGRNIDNRDNKKVQLEQLIAKARQDHHNDALEAKFTEIETHAREDINFYKDDNFSKILQMPAILQQISIAKYENYEQSLKSLTSARSTVFEAVLYARGLTLRDALRKAESDLSLTSEYILARNQLLEIAVAILENPKSIEIPNKIAQMEALFSEKLAVHIPTLQAPLSDVSLAAKHLHQFLMINSINAKNTHVTNTLKKAFDDYKKQEQPNNYDTKKLWELVQLARLTDGLESLHSSLKTFTTTSNSNFDNQVVIHGNAIYETILKIIEQEKSTPLNEKDSSDLDQIIRLVIQILDSPKDSFSIDQLKEFTKARAVGISALLKQLEPVLSGFHKNASLKASQMTTLSLASKDYQKEYVNRLFTNLQQQASTNPDFYDQEHFLQVTRQINHLESQVRGLKQLEERKTEFEQNLGNLSTKPEIELHQKGSQLLSHIQKIAGHNLSTLTTEDLSLLNNVLRVATNALRNRKDSATIRELGELSQQASGKSSRLWKGLGLALLAFTGAVLVVAGVLGAIPTGGVSLMLVAAGAAALTVAGSASVVKGSEHGFAKSISMFKVKVSKSTQSTIPLQDNEDKNATPDQPDQDKPRF